MRIDILGAGCPKCRQTERAVKEALARLGMVAEVAHVTDPRAIARYQVVFTPAIVIDGEVVLAGRVPSVEEAQRLLSRR